MTENDPNSSIFLSLLQQQNPKPVNIFFFFFFFFGLIEISEFER
jgi:hypothetical protein